MRQPPNLALAEALIAVRHGRELNQEEVAYKAGISVAALGRIERGENDPLWTTVERIAGALGVSLVELAQAIEDG